MIRKEQYRMYQEKATSNLEKKFSAYDVLNFLASKTVWILLVGVLCAAIVGCYSKFAIEPTYESYVTMPVFNKTVSNNESVTSGDITASESLAKTYSLILESDTMLTSVIGKLKEMPSYSGLELEPKELLECMSITTLNDTQILKITITTTDAVLSKDIANVFAEVAPDILESKFPIGGVENLDYAKVAEEPVGPSVVKNSIIAFFIGAFAVIIIFVFKLSLDFTIHQPDDIEKITDLPIVGVLPTMAFPEDKELKAWKISSHKVLKLGKKDTQ